jgi:hypothetical protein
MRREEDLGELVLILALLFPAGKFVGANGRKETGTDFVALLDGRD